MHWLQFKSLQNWNNFTNKVKKANSVYVFAGHLKSYVTLKKV